MNNKQLDKLIKQSQPGRWKVDGGLYLRISSSGSSSWQVRYTIAGKRRWFTLEGTYPLFSIDDAKLQALLIKSQVKQGIDPAATRQREEQEEILNVNDLFEDWYKNDLSKRLKHPLIPKRIYRKELKPYIGKLAVENVNPRDIRSIIQTVMNSGRNSTANQALMYVKQLFRHAIKLDLITSNPAQPFTQTDAGGISEGRDRALSLNELAKTFAVFRENPAIFTRENYLACGLLVSLGVRKGELIAAKWQDFNIEKRLWDMPEENKTGVAITIPLPEATIPWLNELHVRACGSEYVFPSRRASKRRAYISDDTLNHALAKLFGKKVDSNKQPYEDILGKVGIEHFTIHDLRRTCRSLLASLSVPGHIAERCLNHKLKGVEGIYDRYDYLDERKEALGKLSEKLAPIVNGDKNVISFRQSPLSVSADN